MRAEHLLLACPRVDPEWELGALRALMKPQLKGAVEHRSGKQRWPRGAKRVVEQTCAEVGERLGVRLGPEFPEAGEYFAVWKVLPEHEMAGRALLRVLSRRMIGMWFVAGRLFVRDGRFYRRRFGYRLELREATDVHLTREMRYMLKGLA